MVFYIIEKKANDLYVIYDSMNGGMCCCTPYTIKQLIELGHEIPGVILSPKFSVTILTKSGEVAKKYRVYNVDETKRSAVTIAKGIKLTREEKRALKETVEKRNATRKENQKIAKQKQIEEEKLEKERIKQEELRKKELEVVYHKRHKSKCLAELVRVDIESSEYQSREWYTYKLTASTPSALTAMNKIVAKGSSFGDNLKGASERIKMGRSVEYEVRLSFDLIDRDYDGVQVIAGKEVYLTYQNFYDDGRLYARFPLYINYKATILENKGVDITYFGSSAGSEFSIDGFSKYFRKNLGRIQ